MEGLLDIENLNDPIYWILRGYESDYNPISEEERRLINNEIIECVPIESDNEDEESPLADQITYDDENNHKENKDEDEQIPPNNNQEKEESAKNIEILSARMEFLRHYNSDDSCEISEEYEQSKLSGGSSNSLNKKDKGIKKSDCHSTKKKVEIMDISKLQNKIKQQSLQLQLKKRWRSRNVTSKLKIPNNVACPYQSYFLLGDVVIEMNFSSVNNESFQNCILNMYKPVQRVVYNKNTRCLSIFQASNNEFLIDFSFLSKQLVNYPDQNVHLVGRLIEKYQEIARLIHLQIKNARSMIGFDPELVMKRRAHFDEQVNAFLAKIDEHQMYFIQKFQTNYDNASFEVSEIGYSRQFLALLGTDENTITNIILRKGKPELYNFDSRLKMMLVRMLSIVQGTFKGAQCDFDIYTFDGIKVQAKLKIVPVCIDYPPHLQYNLENYKEINVMAFGLIEVSPTLIQQVITFRQQDKCHRYMKSIVQELNYSAQSEMFLQKYYEISKQKLISSRQNLQKRKRISEDNEKILKSNQSMQIKSDEDLIQTIKRQENSMDLEEGGSIDDAKESNHSLNDSFNSQNGSDESMKSKKSNNSQSRLSQNYIDFECPIMEDVNKQSNQYCYYNNNSFFDFDKQSCYDIEAELIKHNHFEHIHNNYISQNVQLTKTQNGISVVSQQQFGQPSTSPIANCYHKQQIVRLENPSEFEKINNLQFEFNFTKNTENE